MRLDLQGSQRLQALTGKDNIVLRTWAIDHRPESKTNGKSNIATSSSGQTGRSLDLITVILIVHPVQLFTLPLHRNQLQWYYESSWTNTGEKSGQSCGSCRVLALASEE